jgi:hypothetical protein
MDASGNRTYGNISYNAVLNAYNKVHRIMKETNYTEMYFSN